MSESSRHISHPSPASSISKLSALPALDTAYMKQQNFPNPTMQTDLEPSATTAHTQPPTSPMFPSSLPYTLVRDFAYPVDHRMHYGPPEETSGPATPASERRLSDIGASWEQKMPWDSWTADGFGRGLDVPPLSMGDGPPYSEDEDLQSPVVATRQRRHKSTSAAFGADRGRTGRSGNPADNSGILNSGRYDDGRGYYRGNTGDGRDRYFVGHGGQANGPGGDIVSYPSARQPHRLSRQVYEDDESDNADSPAFQERDESRYSRDYQFTITSPDEEFHGKAVALYDFARENENELPLVEGQIIWVSYRHGQGWLVAEDPKTEESGLVPEEYVRLLRDIEGGMNSLTGPAGDGPGSPVDAGTPTQAEHPPIQGNASNGYQQPVVSVFSTSSKDLNPYPTGQLHQGQSPPQVVHYQPRRGSSQGTTPTVGNGEGGEMLRRESMDTVMNSKNGPRGSSPETRKDSIAEESG